MKVLRKNWEKIALYIIISLAFLLRIISITKFPGGFHADEVSFGYDAYSIFKTGRDQWGNFLPIVLKSFGDFKMPLYSYIDVIPIALFGLSKFATRLPAPFIGAMSVLVVYFLVDEIFKEKKIALLSSFLLAINPWSIMLGRGAFESNLIVLLIPLSILFFYKGLKNPILLVWSSIFFGLSLFSYHSAKVIVPLIIGGLVIFNWNAFRKIKFKKIIVPIVIFTVFVFGLSYTISIGGGARVAERSITQGALEEGAKEKIAAIARGANPTLAKIEHNKYQVVANRFITNYSQYLSSRFLFTQGAGEPTYGMIPGVGVIYAFEGILLIGLIPLFLIKRDKYIIFVIFWILVGILPASLSSGIGFAGNRASGMLPGMQILEALGFFGFLLFFARLNKYVYFLLTISLAVLAFFNVYKFITVYFNPPHQFYSGMLYGDFEVGNYLLKNAENSNSILISRSLSEPQIFIAFAYKWDPKDYQLAARSWDLKANNTPWVDQLPEYRLGKFVFKSINWKDDVKSTNVIVAKPDDFPKNIIPDKIINYPDGSPSIYVKNL